MKTICFNRTAASFGGAIRVDYDGAKAHVLVPYVGVPGGQATIVLNRCNLKPVARWDSFYLADKATEEIDRLGFPLAKKVWKFKANRHGRIIVLARINERGRWHYQQSEDAGPDFETLHEACRFVQGRIEVQRDYAHGLEGEWLRENLLQYAERTTIEHKLRRFGYTVEYDMPGEGFVLCDLEGEPVDATAIPEGQAMHLIRELEAKTT